MRVKGLLCRSLALHYWMRDAHFCSGLQGPRLRNDLYCVEWDVKLYYTYTCRRRLRWLGHVRRMGDERIPTNGKNLRWSTRNEDNLSTDHGYGSRMCASEIWLPILPYSWGSCALETSCAWWHTAGRERSKHASRREETKEERRE